MSEELKMYENVVQHLDGTTETIGYAYGPSWVSQALMMGDIRFDTPEEARAWWDRWVAKYGYTLTDD